MKHDIAALLTAILLVVVLSLAWRACWAKDKYARIGYWCVASTLLLLTLLPWLI